MTDDPFAPNEETATAANEADPFDDPTDDFIRPDDLVDRTLIIAPRRVEQRKSDRSDGHYNAFFCYVIVTDGEQTDKIGPTPFHIEEMMLSGQVLEQSLRPKVGKTGPKSLVLGRLEKQAAQKRGNNAAWVLRAIEDPEAKQKLVPLGNELLAKLKGESDPFS